ncbi:MAG: spore coat associated protein CotJA [Clostridiales bacterium]|jgi:hypothetical protein|nr:spore coat associated protein CotJA [Clostridiales bacterium]
MFEYRKPNGAAGGAMPNRPMPQKTALAQAYVPEQKFEALYSPDKALMQGTFFKN